MVVLRVGFHKGCRIESLKSLNGSRITTFTAKKTPTKRPANV